MTSIKTVLTCLALAFLNTAAQAEKFVVTFGAATDLAVSYGEYDLTGNAKPTANIAAPRISIGGLDLDGLGTNDDQIVLEFAVTSEGGEIARLAQGYRLDAGYTLTFEIASTSMKMASGKTIPLVGKFRSATGNNRGSTFTSNNMGTRIVLKSTSQSNNRARNLVVEFDLPVDASKLAPPVVVPVVKSPVPRKRPGRSSTHSNLGKKITLPVKPTKAVAPPKVVTESLLLPRLFCDHMVLQQQTKNAIWGWAQPGESVTVKASWGEEVSAVASDEGRWKTFLETPKFGTGHSLTVAGKKDTIQINNVAIGEVWLCVGQSNMGWSMGNSFEAEKEADVNLPDFRIFKSSREHWDTPLEMQRDRLSQWKPCNPASAAETSAVSYYFGKKLHQELGVPVGIIQQAFAGTPIEGWMPWEIQSDDPRAQAHKALLDQRATSGGSREAAMTQYNQELAEYNASIDAGMTMKNSFKALSPPIITKPANLGHQYPGHEFNAMIYPIRPYGIRGVIWYQGERNSKDVPQAANYRKQLALLVRYYRTSWHKLSGGGVADDFPFQFTQLPSWTPEQTEPVEGLQAPWAVNREMMRLVTHDVPKTAIAVSIDTGSTVALHPKNKKPIGIRHAYLALKQTYGKDFVDYGPRYKGQTIQDNQIVMEFDSVGSGMVAAKPGKIDAFAIAGDDQVWHWADASIDGNRVAVSSPKVPRPIAVRYAWGMNPSQRNLLYNKEGIPASPFRTDHFPLFDPDAEIVTVVKPSHSEGKENGDWERPKMSQ